MKYIFIGEERSDKAIRMNVTWKDGRLAAKQLFDALKLCGINPEDQKFYNAFDGKDQPNIFKSYGSLPFVAMGNKASAWLIENGMDNFIKIVHPAARGKIRLKKNYYNHIKESLCQTLKTKSRTKI